MSDRKEILLGLFFFIINFILAVYQQWSATDLLWSLWISSLTLGYAYILTAILGMLFRGDQLAKTSGEVKKNKSTSTAAGMNVFLFIAALFFFGLSLFTLIFFILVVLSVIISLSPDTKEKWGLAFLPDQESVVSRFMIALPTAMFLLGFFSFHFIFFHFVHSIFLNGFFPLLNESPFGKTIDGTFRYFFDIIRLALHKYWMFILLSGMSRLTGYTQAFASRGVESMFIPYKNVVRMHITIFVLAFLSIAGISQQALYFVFIIYFLPLGSLFQLIFVKKNAVPPGPPPVNKPIE